MINPNAGAGQGRRAASVLEEISLPNAMKGHVVFTDPARLGQQVLSLAPSYELVVIGGGDGTINRIVRLMAELAAPPPFAILPLGTGNDLARSTGWLKVWQSGGLATACLALGHSKVRSLDLWGDAKGLSFLSYPGLGLDAKIVDIYENRIRPMLPGATPSSLKKAAFATAGLIGACGGTLSAATPVSTIQIQDGKDNRHEFKITAGNGVILTNIDSYAGGTRLPQGSRWDDGLLEALIYKGPYSLLSLVLKGRLWKTDRQAQIIKAKRCLLRALAPTPLQLDGEFAGIKEEGWDTEIEVIRAMPFLSPPGDFFARQMIGAPQKDSAMAEQRGSAAMPGTAMADGPIGKSNPR